MNAKQEPHNIVETCGSDTFEFGGSFLLLHPSASPRNSCEGASPSALGLLSPPETLAATISCHLRMLSTNVTRLLIYEL